MCFVESTYLVIISLSGIGISLFDVGRQFILKLIIHILGLKLTILMDIGLPACKANTQKSKARVS